MSVDKPTLSEVDGRWVASVRGKVQAIGDTREQAERLANEAMAARATAERRDVATLEGAALEWAVASIEYPEDALVVEPELWADLSMPYEFTTNWRYGGPIIDREHMALNPAMGGGYVAHIPRIGARSHQLGPTALVAAMRCFVASRYGAEVEIPDAVLQGAKA